MIGTCDLCGCTAIKTAPWTLYGQPVRGMEICKDCRIAFIKTHNTRHQANAKIYRKQEEKA